jgi:hypothetical protein
VFDRFRILGAAGVLAVGLAAAIVIPAQAVSTTAYLDSFSATDASSPGFCSGPKMLEPLTPVGCGNSVTAPLVFETGVLYTVKVVGAVSSWGAWPYKRCGKPEPSSEFGSSAITNRPAGDDAQFRFAQPLYIGTCHFNNPKKTSFFQVNLGSGWFHPVATPSPAHPSNDGDKAGDQHPYSFTFTGQGVAPQFRYVDYHPSDNSGRFKITIEP